MTLDYSEVSLMIATFFINLQCQKRTGSIGNFSTSLKNWSDVMAKCVDALIASVNF